MTIEVKQVTTESPGVTAYKVILTEANGVPAAPVVELTGIGREVFEELEREAATER